MPSFTSIILICSLFISGNGNWDDWWTYDGISGTDFWGLLNPDWVLCNRGKRQSPINIDPSTLLFDPGLGPLRLDSGRISGILENNGHFIIFRTFHPGDEVTSIFMDQQTVNQSAALGRPTTTSKTSEHNSTATVVPITGDFNSNSTSIFEPSTMNYPQVTISGGPFSYTYTIESVAIHFGRSDLHGSEHVVAGVSFPAEVQIVGYNSDLYQNLSDASNKANGLAGISLLVQFGNASNSELRTLTSLTHHIRFRGQNVSIKNFSIRDLLPDLDSYMTYEGSLTTPGCPETVTWVVVNKPIFITRQQLYALRKLMQGDSSSPKASLGNNFRPTQGLHQRVVRTNIDFKKSKKASSSECPSMKTRVAYQVNSKHVKN